MVINVLHNTRSGPGGRARHLHEGDLGFDARGKAKLLPEVVLRKRIKRSANSTTLGMALVAGAIALGTVANSGTFVRRKKEGAIAA